MAGTSLKLINKLMRRMKSVKEVAGGFGAFDKIFLSPSVMQDSPRAYELLRKAVRRIDRAFGQFGTENKPVLHADYVATSLGRVSIGGGHYATQLTLPAADEGYKGAGAIVGDYVLVTQQNSVAEAQYLKVLTVVSTTQLNLTDVPAFATPAVAQIDTVATVADVAGSLQSTDWYINSEGNVTQYYVWYNVSGGGTDPAPGGKTGIPVAITTGASANTVASATQTALNAVGSHPWTATVMNNTITVTWNTAGAVTEAANGGASPGFTIAQVRAGANANPTPTAESNVAVRLESNGPKSYH